MHHYYILTLDPNMGTVIRWVLANQLEYEPHLRRTRFWIPDGPVYTEFLLRFAECCTRVDDTVDLATGHRRL